MNTHSKDDGVLAAIVESFEEQILPRVSDLKNKVDQGEELDDMDIGFLERVFAETNEALPLLERHPEYQHLAANITNLYHEIMTKALENEKK